MKINLSDIAISRVIIAVAGFLTVLLSIIVSLKQDTLMGILFMTTANLGELGNLNAKNNRILRGSILCNSALRDVFAFCQFERNSGWDGWPGFSGYCVGASNVHRCTAKYRRTNGHREIYQRNNCETFTTILSKNGQLKSENVPKILQNLPK